MIISFKKVLKYFQNNKLKDMKVRVNFFAKSVWFCTEDEIKVNVRLTDSYEIIRLYATIDGVDTKISYISTSGTLIMSTRENETDTFNEIKIENIHEITSEEILFQRSLVDNVLDLTYDNIILIHKLHDEAKVFALTKFGELDDK
ncbi:hypothetical protein ABV23_RS01235 [Escherichia coli]|nr:hypothetical protein [Escherichia coli]